MIRLACEAQEDAEIDELIAESQLEHTPEEKEITRNAYLLFQRKLAEQEQKERKDSRRRRVQRILPRTISVAACLVILLAIATPFAVANISSIRVKVLQMLIRIEEDHAKLSLVEDADASFDVPSGWQGDYYPTYIPDGYEVFNVIPYYATVEISNVEGDVRFISKKQDRFATHEGQENNKRLDTVYHEIQGAIKLKWLGKRSNLEIDRFAYYISEKLIEAYDEQENPSRLISSYVMKGFFDSLPRQQYAQLMDALKKSKESSPDAVVIKSIEAVKGLEAEKCLFILTSDLAPYLFGQRVEDNKTSHLLYVALTRSLNSLSILVTKEVEKKYNREVIKKYLELI